MDVTLSSLKGKGICVFGLKGSGKSVWARNLIAQFKNHIVVDPMLEYKGCRRYIPDNRFYGEESTAEIDLLTQFLVVPKKNNGKAKVDLLVIDEANRYCPSRHPLPPTILDINDYQRHWDLTTVYVARRPVQLNTDLVELANYLVIYNLAGKNDRQYLNDLSEGLGDAVLELPKYHYMFVDENRHYKVMKPVNIIKTGKTRKEVKLDDEISKDHSSD